MAPRRTESVGSGSPAVRSARSLRQSTERLARSEFLVEGEKVIRDAHRAGVAPRSLYFRRTALESGALDELLLELTVLDVPSFSVQDSAYDQMCDSRSPGPVTAIYAVPSAANPAPGITLVLDGLQDPGNVGATIRSAVACGAVSEILCLGGADPFGARAVRAAAGTFFVVPPLRIAPPDLTRLAGRRVIVASARLGVAHHSFAWLPDDVIVIGSEGSGESDHVRAIATDHVTISLANGVESLNAAVAASILLFSVIR